MRRVVVVSQVGLAVLLIGGVAVGIAVGLTVGVMLASRSAAERPIGPPAVMRAAAPASTRSARLARPIADEEAPAEVQPVGDLPPMIVIPESDEVLDLFDADGQILLQVAPEDGDYYALLSDLMLQASDESAGDSGDEVSEDDPARFIQRVAAHPRRPRRALHPIPRR